MVHIHQLIGLFLNQKTYSKYSTLLFIALSTSSIAQLAPEPDLAEQVENQQQQLENQGQEIQHLRQTLDTLQLQLEQTELTASTASSPAPPSIKETSPAEERLSPFVRDGVGDMRADVIHQGNYPASITVMGSKAPVQLAIGGFIKTVAYSDSHYEKDDPFFFPSLLGLGRDDENGQFAMSAVLSRIYLDARTYTGKGQLRGYIEMDFRNDITLRHAYMDWDGKYGQLKIGRYWSTFMDLQALTEGVTEPLVSGASLARQEQVRYTKYWNESLTFAIAAEDPSNNDILTSRSPKTSVPDVISTLKIELPNKNHIQLGALYRQIDINSYLTSESKVTGWGTSVSGRINLTSVDSIVYGVAYGDGIGRYLLGLDPFSGAYVDPESSDLKSREGKGAYISHAHHWSKDIRTNIMYGEAHAENIDFFLPETFISSKYFASNIFYEATPYLVFGLEYAWGSRENAGDNSLDNQRVTLGAQLF